MMMEKTTEIAILPSLLLLRSDGLEASRRVSVENIQKRSHHNHVEGSSESAAEYLRKKTIGFSLVELAYLVGTPKKRRSFTMLENKYK